MIRAAVAVGLLVICDVPAPAAVLVAYESGVAAYGDALRGLEASLGAEGMQALDLREPGAEARLNQALAKNVQVVVAVGSQAVAAVRLRNAGLPVIVTMVLRPADTAGISAYLDVGLPLRTLLPELRMLLPRRRRLGIIRGPAQSRQTAEALESAALKEGYTAVVVDCDGPANLLRAVRALRGKIDVLLCFPDAGLYNAVTIKPLLLTALEERLPVVGFSPAFVQAGAAAGIYPDYYEIGRQAAEIALRIARGEKFSSSESPRRVRAAVNERVARLLGLDFHAGSEMEVFR